MNSVAFSKTEQQLLSLIYAGNNAAALARLREIEWIKGEGSETKPILEAKEFLDKLADLKIDLPLVHSLNKAREIATTEWSPRRG